MILSGSLSCSKRSLYIVGLLQKQRSIKNARKKLETKQLDMVLLMMFEMTLDFLDDNEVKFATKL